MVFTDYELGRMALVAINKFIGQEWVGIDASTSTPSPTDTTMDTELDRYAVDSVVLNTSTGTYQVTMRIPLLSLDGNTIRRYATFDAASSGTMGLINDLPSAYAIDTTHEVRLIFTVTAAAVDTT